MGVSELALNEKYSLLERTGSNAATLDALHDVVAALDGRAVHSIFVARAASAALKARQRVEAERAALLPAKTASGTSVGPPARDNCSPVGRRACRRSWTLDRNGCSSKAGSELGLDVVDACRKRRSWLLEPARGGRKAK